MGEPSIRCLIDVFRQVSDETGRRRVPTEVRLGAYRFLGWRKCAGSRANFLKQGGQAVKIAHLVQEVARTELGGGATVFTQVVIGQNDGDDIVVATTGQGTQHAKAGA